MPPAYGSDAGADRGAAVKLGWLGLVMILGAAGQGRGQAAGDAKPDAVITFRLERPGVPVPSYVFTVHEDGRGSYEVTYPAVGYTTAAETVTMPLKLRDVTTAGLFEKVRSTDHLRGGCESKAKNIANTGTKTLSYAGADGTASCVFNFTENKVVSSLTETFLGMAYTLDAGRELQQKQRFDHLGLDREMNALADGVRDGKALEVVNIAPILRSLADDTAVMERVRTRAAKLLEQSGTGR